VGIASALIGVAAALSSALHASVTLALFVFIALPALILIPFVLYYVSIVRPGQQAVLQQPAPVWKLEGYIGKYHVCKNRVSHYYYAIENTKFVVPEHALNVLIDGVRYAVYYLPQQGMLLSVEPLL
jgi:hypothetical protein